MSQHENRKSEVLHRVRDLLDTGRAEQALDLLKGGGNRSKAAVNAYGVCLMRLGRIDEATAVFRKLVASGAGFSIDTDTPTVFQTNYGMALLLGKHVDGCVGVLNQIKDQAHPAVIKIRGAIEEWKRTLGSVRRFLALLLGLPDATVPTAFPPGDLWISDPDGRGKKAA